MTERSGRGRRPSIATTLIALGLVGCTAVPRGRLEESRQQILSLRAELAQTKDQAARLRTQNREIAARSVEDVRRLSALEEANERLEQSVIAYQEERDQYASSFEAIRREVLASTGSRRPTALRERLEPFLAEHEACRYDDETESVVIREDGLFGPGSDALTAGGSSLIEALGAALSGAGRPDLSPRVVASREGDAIRLTSGTTAPDLGRRRAEAIRDRLASASRIDPRKISTAVEDDETTPPRPERTVRINLTSARSNRSGT